MNSDSASGVSQPQRTYADVVTGSPGVAGYTTSVDVPGVNEPRQLPSSNAMQSGSSRPQRTRNLPIRYGHYVTH